MSSIAGVSIVLGVVQVFSITNA